MVLANTVESADVTTELVDVGRGTKAPTTPAKMGKGKIVLSGGGKPGARCSIWPSKIWRVGNRQFYAQNQKTAWSGENETLIRGGHLDNIFREQDLCIYMVSLKAARSFQHAWLLEESQLACQVKPSAPWETMR